MDQEDCGKRMGRRNLMLIKGLLSVLLLVPAIFT
jgi:hypothetical protein